MSDVSKSPACKAPRNGGGPRGPTGPAGATGATGPAGSSQPSTLTKIAGANLSAGMPCSITAAAVPAQAATSPSTATVAGLVVADAAVTTTVILQYAGPLTLTTAQWDARTSGSGGLFAGLWYYLSPSTPGAITATAPSVGGEFVTPIGYAYDATTMIVNPGPPVAA